MGLWGQPEPEDDSRPRRTAAVRLHGARALIALALAVVTYLLFPSAAAVDTPLYEVGGVAPETVIAPFSFRVPKAAAEVETERQAARRATAAVFAPRLAARDSALAALDRFLADLEGAAARPAGDADAPIAEAAARAGVRLTADEAAYLRLPARRRAVGEAVRRVFERWLAEGVASNAAVAEIRGEIAVPRGERMQLLDADSVRSFDALLVRARAAHPDPRSAIADAVYVKLLGAFFRPTLVPDPAATERRRAAAARDVDPNRWLVRAGEKIVGAHEVVGREEYDKLRTLREVQQRRQLAEASTTQSAGRVAGAILLDLAVIVVFGVSLLLFRPALYENLRAVALFAVGFLTVLVAAAFVARMEEPRPELIPVAFAAVLFSILFDPRISLIAAMTLSVLVGAQGPFRGTNAMLVVLVGGVAAAVSVRTVRRRNQAYLSMLVVAGGYLLAAIALGLSLGWSWQALGVSAGYGALNAVAAIALAFGLLPPAEDFTGIDTYLRLLEWSDLNRPLMQRLSLEAPGTYAHTIAMANLVEAACNAIGANGLLGRVGTYYHDIGKLERPIYFVENQPKGRNPHDKLKPTASASIIRNHVREGLELAAEHKLPKAVRAFITEHHGTNRIVYFYEKARERGDGVAPSSQEFQYPGPRPQTPETAVCMLADGVEAAARALHDPTPQKLRELVDRIVRQRIDEGQLRDAPLTLRQIETVKDQFVRVLLGMYHNRIDYPSSTAGAPPEVVPA